jgi:hypothetical protein
MAITVHTRSNATLSFPDANHIIKVSDVYLAVGSMGVWGSAKGAQS